jgi:hypothetical protein
VLLTVEQVEELDVVVLTVEQVEELELVVDVVVEVVVVDGKTS